MDSHVADLGQDAQGQGKLVVAAIDNLFVVDRDIPAALGGQQLRQQPPKRLVFAPPTCCAEGPAFPGLGPAE